MHEKYKDHVVDQNYSQYTQAEHDLWAKLFHRQITHALIDRVEDTFLNAFEGLDLPANHIPVISDLSDHIYSKTKWRILPVVGLVPDPIFFDMLSNRVFPTTCFLRKPEQMDYIQEPDMFHDIFGHVPLLTIPIFADYMQAYGQAGLSILDSPKLKHLARLYWYTVEFGLINTPKGLRTYGAGVASSYKETFYCLESPIPHRLRFNADRVMLTNYKIDDVQATYFVIDRYEDLFDLMTTDLEATFNRLSRLPVFNPGEITDNDQFI